MDRLFSREVTFVLELAEVAALAVAFVVALLFCAWILRRSTQARESDRHHERFREQARQFQEQIQLLEKELRDVRHGAMLNAAHVLTKRADAVEGVYRHLVHAQRALRGAAGAVQFRGSVSEVSDALEAATPQVKAYSDVFEEQRLYFSETGGDWIAELNMGCIRALENARVITKQNDQLGRDVTDQLDELLNRALGHLAEAREQTEKQCRDILGSVGGAPRK